MLHGARARQYWVDLDTVGDTPIGKGKHVSESLSSHHNRAQVCSFYVRVCMCVCVYVCMCVCVYVCMCVDASVRAGV